jgi:hypothetical protein
MPSTAKQFFRPSNVSKDAKALHKEFVKLMEDDSIESCYGTVRGSLPEFPS